MDTFAAFVDRLADSLDDHDATGAELAARACLSRFHFDRVVSAAETFVDATCDPPQVFTYGGMLAHVLTFAAHRRTLAIGALHSGGITDLGAGDPMRWVADAG